MILTAIAGNLTDDPALIPPGDHRETAWLDDQQRTKRTQRLTTDHGTEVGLRLPAGHPDLRDGDVLLRGAGRAIVVRARPSDVLVIAPRDLHEMGVVAHSLGNRHLPAQFMGERMVVQWDTTVVDFLDHHGVPYRREERVMPLPFRHAEHTH
ncbi:urease accessory protein UreE [Corynebacterium sp. zg-331]|uniref:urease accessory protein UreE n=1 Tax=unclassified Corynebacterium TaxID=2624378 RepID=UPI00128D6C95|nr:MULTISPECIES: urease accessory protein UreE [unclassified Corynebacterium]MBC3186726.1 urease accessory protein UreE [Corynebacterium sp. zg-331]MPV53208.1 urease accessory protein UreE [Corynebacterium sp. zg331]